MLSTPVRNSGSLWAGALLLCAGLLGCKGHPQAASRAAQSGVAGASTTRISAASTSTKPQRLWLPDAQAPAPVRSDPGVRPLEQPTRYRVAAIGDSLTDARNGGGRYLKYLKERCPNSVFDNYGVGGEMVNQMRRRFARDVLDKRIGVEQSRYTHVIVFGGVNDLYSDQTAGRSNDKIQKDLSFMYGAARAAGIEVVAVAVAPWGGFTRYFNERRGQNTVALNQWMRAQLDANQVDHWVDAYSLLSCGEPTRLCEQLALPFKDGLHFGTKGQEILGKTLLEQVFADCH